MSAVERPAPGRIRSHLWSVVSWVALSGLVAGGVAALYYYQRADEELRRMVERLLAEAYPQLSLRVGSAHFQQGEGIRLGQISVRRADGSAGSERSEIGYLEELRLLCDTSLPRLVQGQFTVREVVLQGLSLHLTWDESGQVDVRELIPVKLPPCRGKQLPRIRCESGTVHLRPGSKGTNRVLDLEDVRCDVRLKRLTAPQAEGFPEILAGITIAARTGFCREVELEGVARTTDGAWTLGGKLVGCVLSPDSLAVLPSGLQQACSAIAPLRGLANLEFQVGARERGKPVDYSVGGQFRQGTWQDVQLAQLVTDLNFDFHAGAEGLRIEQLTARVGNATLAGNLHLAQFSPQSPFTVHLGLNQFQLTQPMIDRLPAVARAQWEKFQALGSLSGEIEIHFDGTHFSYNVTVDCHDMTAQHYKFPYPVQQCHGRVTLRDQELRFDVEGMAGEAPVSIKGVIHNPGVQFTGWWEVKTHLWKKIDDGLLAALPKEVGRFVRSLQPRGRVGFWVRHVRDSPDHRPPPQIVVAIDQGWIHYERFPYPISNVHGRIEARDGNWTFRELAGTNDSSQIRCEGVWRTAEPDQPLNLKFSASHVHLDTELKAALPANVQTVWNQLRPQGQLDQVEVQLFKVKGQSRPQIDVRVEHRLASDSGSSGESLQIFPVRFPLRLNQVRGKATYRDDDRSLQLQEFTAEHGPIRVRTNGDFESTPGGGWRFSLTDLAVDHLDLREAVLDALPRPLARTLRQLSVSGNFALAGGLLFSQPSADDELFTSWNLRLDADQAGLNFGLRCESIFGQVLFDGTSQGTQFASRAELLLDSLVSQNVQLTRIHGPLWIDTERVIFGQAVPPQVAGRESAPLVASAYQGQASLNGEVSLGNDHPFSVQANVTNADVTTIARDWKLGQGTLSGQVLLELFLTGDNRGRDTLKGNGTAQLRNANLYELPLILALLGRLGTGRTAQAAFTTSDLAFHVRDGYVYFDRFDLAGDAITLKGIGEMALSSREIDLDFYSIIGREQLWSPLVRPFLGEASRQFLQIHVDGTLSDPRTTQEVLPGLNETLQQLFPEVTAPPDRPPAGAFLSPRGHRR